VSWRKRPWLVGLSVAAFLVLIALGTWQVQRLQWKTALIEAADARASGAPVPLGTLDLSAPGEILYTHISVSGGFPTDRTAHVFGTLGGQPGYYVFQPFLLDDGSGRRLLVNRGFVPQDERAASYPLPDAPALTGLLRVYEGAGGIAAAFTPEGGQSEGTFYERDPARLITYLDPEHSADYLPISLDSTLPTELPRGGTTRLDFRNAHLGYAITWYGLAAGLVGVLLFAARRGRREAAASRDDA
jgi:surfeit locus 1 family protein